MGLTLTVRTDFSLTMVDIDRTVVMGLMVAGPDRAAVATVLAAEGSGRTAGALDLTMDPIVIDVYLPIPQTEAEMAITV
jgi:hypothetical protein